MKIKVLYFRGCPNHPLTVKRVREVVDELGVDAQIDEVEVTSDDDVVSLRFAGSPTVLVDGVDIDPSQRENAAYGFGCRTFDGQGVPSKAMIRDALTRRSETERTGGTGSPTAAESEDDANNLRRNFFWAGLGAIGSSIGASACCWLPAIVGTAGVSLVGAGEWFKATRPFLLGAAGLMIAFGFYHVYRRRTPCTTDGTCARSGDGDRFGRLSLWVTTAIVIAVALLPYYSSDVAQLFKGASARPAKITAAYSSPPSPASAGTVDLPIRGMTCPACATRLQRKLVKLPGVTAVKVSFAHALATIHSSAKGVAPGRIVKTVHEAGFAIASQCAGECQSPR